MKYLSRSKISHKEIVNKNAKKVYIFCEGEKTEIKYLEFFKGLSSNIDIIPIPPINGQTDPIKLKEFAELLFFGDDLNSPKFSLSSEFKDEVWFAIDTDRWNENNKIQQLKDFCIEKNISEDCWFVAQSNPSFEIWLYYHFNSTKPINQDIAKFSSFKHFVHKSTNNGNGFDPDKHPIEIETAIVNSENNFQKFNNQPDLYSTEFFILGKIIVSFVESQLIKLKKMIKM